MRLAHPLAFAAFLQHVGAPVEGYFRRQGLPALCKNPNVFVPLKKAWALFNDAAQREDELFGWYVGQYVGEHNLSAGLLQKLEDAPSLYQALLRLIRLVSSEASHLQLGIMERRNSILFFTKYSGMEDEPGYHASQAYQLEVYSDLIRQFAGTRWMPEEIGIQLPTVPALVEEHFSGSQILANQPFGYITIARSYLHNVARSGQTKRGGENPLVLTSDFDYVDTLSIVLEPYLSEGYPSAKFAASLLDTSVRTLARRLSACGKTYQALIDETRFKAAKKLLKETSAPVSDVAGSIGFADQANFSRMFHRIGGLRPRQFRTIAQGRTGYAESMH